MSSKPEPATRGSDRFADLWMLVHEGGLAIETRAAADAPPALRTVLQLDGDRLTTVALGAIAGLSPDDRLRLAAEHLAAVRARSVSLLTRGQAALCWLRHMILAVVAGVELFGAATDWRGLPHSQIVCLILLLCRQGAPRVLPHILRLMHARTARALADARHQETQRTFLSR